MEHLQRLFEKFVPKVLDFRRHHCKELIPTSELNSVASLCVLFDALATEENGVRLKMSCSNLESCLNYVDPILFQMILILYIIILFFSTIRWRVALSNSKHLTVFVVLVLTTALFSGTNILSRKHVFIKCLKLFCSFSLSFILQVHPHEDSFPRMIELWFLFSLIWSICASVDEDSRKKMDNFLREIEGQFPAKVNKKYSRSISSMIRPQYPCFDVECFIETSEIAEAQLVIAYLASVSVCFRSKERPRNGILVLPSSLRNRMETLATQAKLMTLARC